MAKLFNVLGSQNDAINLPVSPVVAWAAALGVCVLIIINKEE